MKLNGFYPTVLKFFEEIKKNINSQTFLVPEKPVQYTLKNKTNKLALQLTN